MLARWKRRSFAASVNADLDQLRSEHLQQWRLAARRVAKAWDLWLASEQAERDWAHDVYVDALAREEQAALILERDACALSEHQS
jgi:hypothetical protein